MLYIYYGTDEAKTLDAMRSAGAALRARAHEATIERITGESDAFDLEMLLASNGLFHAARIVMLDGLFGDPDHKRQILDALADLAASEHIFFIREAKLLAPEKKRLEKHAAKMIAYDVPERNEKAFNRFAIADALLAHDTKRLWIELATALRAGISAEELHGMLFMAAKNLVLASGAASAAESGMNPYVFSKTRAALGRFAPEELPALVASLAELPHDARRSGIELELALERFVLDIPGGKLRTRSPLAARGA